MVSRRVCVIGLGYIGLPTAALVSTTGHEVLGVDTSRHVVSTVSSCRAHIAEPSLDALVRSAVESGRLTCDITPSESDIFMVAVPTPTRPDKTADLSHVQDAVRSVVPFLRKGNLVIVESTIPPGTTETVVAPILAGSGLSVGEDISLAYCPERVLPGKILYEIIENDRIVGGVNAESSALARDFYQTFVRGDIHITDSRTAELAKLIENAFRDVNIAFANEVSLVADHLGVDVWTLIGLANKHPRVNILKPGPGVGGHCIAVDPWFIIEKARELAPLMTAARRVNDSMPDRVVERIRKVVRPGSKVACLGASYKADVGDIRESPALSVIKQLLSHGYRVQVVDPHVEELDGLPLVSLDEALDGADCVALLVDHSEFRRLDVKDLRRRFANGRLVDTRGIWNDD